MRKLFLSLCCALALLTTAPVADAAIFVRITDGTITVDGLLTATRGGLNLAKASLAPADTLDATDTLTVLTCAVRPCTVFFPSGAATAQAGDSFKLQDVSSTSLGRVEKFDSGASADRVSLKGLKITSLVAGKVLTLTYGTQAGDLRALSSTQATSYAATAAMSGSFKTGAGLRATACLAGTTSTEVGTPCARLTLAVNGTTVDGQGTTAISTVSVPCNNSFPSVNPCGTNGIWTASLGTFSGVNDSKSISCPSTCLPVQVGTLVAQFNGVNEVLQLTASAHGGFANVTDENGGVEETALALVNELGANRWVTFSAAVERCRAEPKSPAINDTRNINNSSTLPISFELWCGIYTPAGSAGIPLVSLVDTPLLPGAANTRYEASRETFLPAPGQLALKDITNLSYVYDVFVGTEPNPVDSRLGPLTYADCKNGSLRLEIELLDSKGVNVGVVKVYLGSNASDNFKSACNGFEDIGLNILSNPDARVDTSGLAGNLASACCLTFGQLQKGQLGKYLVRKIAFVVSPGTPAANPAENYKVTFFDGNVTGNGISVSALSSLQLVTGVARSFDLITNGVSIVITKLTGNNPGIVKVVRSQDIVINGGKFTTSVAINDMSPESGADYSVSLCPNGAEQTDPNLPVNTPLGICISDQARLRLL